MTGHAAGRGATTRSRPARRHLGAIAGLLALVVLIWTAVGLIERSDRAHDPESVVRGYVTLLAEGRAQEATDRVAPDVRLGRVVPALLGDAGLAASTRSIRLDRVTERTPAGSDEAVVAVDYTLVGDDGSVGTTHTASLHLVKSRRFLVFTRWRLVDGLAAPVAVRSNIPSLPLTIGATPIPVQPETAPPGPDPDHQVLLYPGTYPVGGAATPWLAADAVVQAPGLGASAVLPQSITFMATPALSTRVDRAVTAAVQACAAAGAAMSAGCPSALRATRDRGVVTITRPA